MEHEHIEQKASCNKIKNMKLYSSIPKNSNIMMAITKQ